MVRSGGGDYRDAVTRAGETDRPRWRATVHALVGLPVAAGIGAVLALVVIVWVAAVLSLIEDPGQPGVLLAVYVATALAGPVLLPWLVLGGGQLQRVRFRDALGVEIPAPPPVPGRWPLRLVRPWAMPAMWRELGYHLLAVVLGVGGGCLVAFGWAAPLLAYALSGRGWPTGLAAAVVALGLLTAVPPAARAVAAADRAAGRVLLGPSRGEALALEVATLARSRADVLAAADAERRRIERDLHDGAQQRLMSLAMNLGMARAALADEPGPARDVIEAAHEEALLALTELREFVRGLHPAVLDDRGLDAALSGIAARAPLPVRLRVDVGERCSPSIEAVAYFVVAEALTNVAKHAHAGRATVTAERRGDRLRLAVTDDGRGGAATGGTGTGLRGLAQRVGAAGGTLDIDSPPGGPTAITVDLPCE
jgi:signal transduction histidine kinase